jgi:hypothetical protein
MAESIVTARNDALPKVAAKFAKVNDKEHVKHLLIPCAYYLDASYRMCGLLAQLYPEQATAIARSAGLIAGASPIHDARWSPEAPRTGFLKWLKKFVS